MSDYIVTHKIIDGAERVTVQSAAEATRLWLEEMIAECSPPDQPLPPELRQDFEPDVEDVGRAEDERRRWNRQ